MPSTDFAALPFTTMRDVRSVQAALVKVLREYTRGDGSTALLRRAAELQVDLRQYFERRDGETDWLGKSYAYRQLMTDTYGKAGVPLPDRKKLGDAIRYHIINVLRERLSPEELAALDLREQDGPTRAKEVRERTRAIVDAAQMEGRVASVTSGPVRLAMGVAGALAAVRANDVRALSAEERKGLTTDLETIRREAGRILRLADSHRVTDQRKKK